MMDQFLLAHGAGQSGDLLLDDCLNQLGDIPPEANFGFLYLSDALADMAESLIARLKEATGITAWVGTVGIGIIGGATEYYDEPATDCCRTCARTTHPSRPSWPIGAAITISMSACCTRIRQRQTCNPCWQGWAMTFRRRL
jgi:hypothetical protein